MGMALPCVNPLWKINYSLSTKISQWDKNYKKAASLYFISTSEACDQQSQGDGFHSSSEDVSVICNWCKDKFQTIEDKSTHC
jgi:hypothetical protein